MPRRVLNTVCKTQRAPGPSVRKERVQSPGTAPWASLRRPRHSAQLWPEAGAPPFLRGLHLGLNCAASETSASFFWEEEQDSDSEKDPPPIGPEDEDGETFSFKYSPGQLRGNQYKKMMTKEELEEEQRVQKEQLAAIFKLMKDNKETFGEMSDGDVQEQLRLYDM
ncbi:matrix-remodeling-associated protein 7 isoform X3 [Ictidomys tridecemlineatus]